MNILFHAIFHHRCNVTKQKDWEELWNHTEKTFAGKVQILVNNAGVNPSHGWKPCIDIMLYGVMIGSFMARERMGRLKVLIKLNVCARPFLI